MDPAVVGQVHIGQTEGEEQVDGAVHGLRIELDRGGGGKNVLAHLAPHGLVQLPIGKAESIPGENALTLLIHNADVVLGVARGIQAEQLPPGQIQHGFVVGLDNPLRVDGQNGAVELFRLGLPIHFHRARPELAGIGHVPGAPGMDHEPGPGESGHKGPGAPRMVQVNVGKDDEIHRLRPQAQTPQLGLNPGQGSTVPRIHHGHMALFHNQVDGIEKRTDITGIQGINTGIETQRIGQREGHGNLAATVGKAGHPLRQSGGRSRAGHCSGKRKKWGRQQTDWSSQRPSCLKAAV